MGVEILVSDSAEPTAVGAAVLAGVGTDCYSDPTVGTSQVLSTPDRYQPTTAVTETYDLLYEQYVQTRSRMTEIWTLHAETRSQLSR